MAVALETRTGRKLAEEDLTSIRTVQDVVDVLHARLC
jgi:acyl carrier protein